MPIDLIIMGTSADRSAADVAIPIAAGETHVSGNGVPGTGTQWYPKDNGAIKGAFVKSETAAMVETWFKKTSDVNRQKLCSKTIQTDGLLANVINYCNYPIAVGDAIEAAGENAGAVLDVLGLYVAKKAGEEAPTAYPRAPLPPNAMLVRATGATTLVADTITEGAIAFDDFTPVRDRVYQILGMAMDGATACASRLKFLEGPNVNDRPGVPAADTSTGLEYMMLYGDFGQFKGQNPPWHQTIGVAGDTAQCFYFVIVPVGGK